MSRIKQIKSKQLIRLRKNYPTIELLYRKYLWKKAKIQMKMDDVTFAHNTYKRKIGKSLNIEHPITFDDKMWYLKLNNRNELLTKCTDKYLVRDYVKECGLECILNELYDTYEKAEDINFSELPDRVFFRLNHTSGYNYLYDKNQPFDKKSFIKRFNYGLKQNHYTLSREWNYKNINPKIVCEKVLENNDGLPLIDYRFLCFNGTPKLLMVDVNTCDKDGTFSMSCRRNIYDINFNFLPIRFSKDNIKEMSIKKPKNYGKMIEFATILSKPFPFCRVDLYNVDGNIFFGEITFYHAGGYNHITPAKWDLRIGSWIDISKIQNNCNQ